MFKSFTPLLECFGHSPVADTKAPLAQLLFSTQNPPTFLQRGSFEYIKTPSIAEIAIERNLQANIFSAEFNIYILLHSASLLLIIILWWSKIFNYSKVIFSIMSNIICAYWTFYWSTVQVWFLIKTVKSF